MEEKEKHTTELDIESNCVLCPCISVKYLQSIHTVNLNKINNTFNHLILVIAQLLNKNIDQAGNQKHMIKFLWSKVNQ